MPIHISVDASEVVAELDRLARGPDPAGFEAILMGSFGSVAARVHVITGFLKASGHVQSSFSGSEWSGTISYARHPGIFELARGDHPTMNHPEGEHYFFGPAYDSDEPYKDEIYRFLGRDE